MRKPVGHVNLHRVEDPESVLRIVRSPVEPSDIESLQRCQVRTGLKSPKQGPGPGIVLLLEKRTHLGKVFCREAGWFFLGCRAEAGHDETQCAGEKELQSLPPRSCGVQLILD